LKLIDLVAARKLDLILIDAGVDSIVSKSAAEGAAAPNGWGRLISQRSS